MTGLFLMIVLTVLACICLAVYTLGWHLGHRNGSQGAVAFNETLYRKRMEFETAQIEKRQTDEVNAMRAKIKASLDYERSTRLIKGEPVVSDQQMAEIQARFDAGEPAQPAGKLIAFPQQEPPTQIA